MLPIRQICRSYADRMAQIITRLDAQLMEQLDAIVSSGEAESRSDAVGHALEAMIDQRRRRLVGEAIVEGCRRVPETDEELRRADENARALVAEEPQTHVRPGGSATAEES